MSQGFKVFSTDLDDTLLRDDLTINPTDAEMLRKIQDIGIHVVFNSGRKCFDSLKKFEEIGLKKDNSYIIGSNGGEVMRLEDQKIIFSKVLDKETVEIVLDYCKRNNFAVEFYYETTHLASTKDNEFHRIHLESVNLQHMSMSFDEMLEFCKSKLPQKFLICESEELIIKKILPEMSALIPSISRTVQTKPYYCEILPQIVSKGEALKWLCEHEFGCTLEQAVAVGDGRNDVEMIRMAGCGGCPSNACEEAKEAAKIVSTHSNMDCFVAHLIEQIFLK